jgi:hypothetical protein
MADLSEGKEFTEFRYFSFTDLETREKIFQPSIEARLINAHTGNSALVRILIDSGAQDTLINAELAKILGINLTTCPEEEVKGIGGRKKGRYHPVEITIIKNGEKVQVPKAYFVKDLGTTAIFGQLDFFSKYVIQFNFPNLSFWIKRLPSTDDM